MNPRHRRALRRRLCPAPRRGSQRGISLIVSLVLVVVATLVALASMRGTVLQTRMSGTSYDRGMAFQAAEAALRDAETRARAATAADIPGAGCSNGFCAQPAIANTPRWQDDAFVDWRAATTAAPPDAPPPEAIVEDQGEAPNWMGCQYEVPRQPNCMTRRYLISARSSADGRASALVQSQYAAP